MSTNEIAIVGVGCRFPGAENLDEFWRVLVNAENHVKDIPDSRWNTSAFYGEDQQDHEKIYVKKAGFLKSHDEWDNKLFGISDVEASRIDPQQRYVLECVHMALEDGGFTRRQISGSKTGVIIGDCDMVICGGVNSILTPDTFKAPCEARMMSAIGQCQSFCDTADGYARGEEFQGALNQ